MLEYWQRGNHTELQFRWGCGCYRKVADLIAYCSVLDIERGLPTASGQEEPGKTLDSESNPQGRKFEVFCPFCSGPETD